MKNKNAIWVLGHKISPMELSGTYDLVMGETPAETPGPPPHFHKGYHEVFIVVEGEMEFVINGEPRTVRKGESVDLPPNAIHTFGNKSDKPCQWVNIHSPKGFLSFFKDLGIPESDSDAITKSVDKSIIQKVMETAPQYDMHIKI